MCDWGIRICLWMGNGPICCLWFQLSMGHCFTLLTHSVYIKQGCKWWWEPESLTKGAPVGRAMTDPFSRYFSLGHRSLVLASIPPFPSKKLRHNHKRVCHLFPLFVATVKKNAVLNLPQDTKVSWGRGARWDLQWGSYWVNVYLFSVCFFIWKMG